ncbi:hypothetical protein SPSIL_058320 [Sporomusa silvacetica DSM 10669]|uniref:50S ribosomal protein L15 n=1 Tax=Sporomusa silvacetica DSM 10669 TaxID=1123289 RepID=A0ABZ3IW52_9FIRM|nr:hypothetical protein [Sporomusa silvacetica]OZC14220.1 hypothetical protein SPSIL_49470 [Sporomusa silvacetica DSM 10669]
MAEQKRKRGAQPGNKNAVGHGAPKGNKNSVGNRGGRGGPVGNKYAAGRRKLKIGDQVEAEFGAG